MFVTIRKIRPTVKRRPILDVRLLIYCKKKYEMKRNETKSTKTKRNEINKNETKRNQRNENEIKRNQRNQRKQNEIRC
jgi:hypothetical protein